MIALCPYLWPWPSIGVALDRAFDSQVVSEAIWHHNRFDAACAQLGEGIGPEEQALQVRLRRNHVQLLLYAQYRSLRSLFALRRGTRGDEAARDLVRECLARAEAASPDGMAHPVVYHLAGDVLRNMLDTLAPVTLQPKRWGRARDSQRDPEYLQALRAEIVKAYDRGRAACWRPELKAERPYNLLGNYARQALFLKDRAESASEREQIETLVRQCIELRSDKAAASDQKYHTAAPGQFYEFLGDRERNHRAAAQQYALGISPETVWAQLFLKYVGALQLSGGLRTEAARANAFEPFRLADRSPRDIRSRVPLSHHGRGMPPWVAARWRAGMEVWSREL
jgi:hypothetical protein